MTKRRPQGCFEKQPATKKRRGRGMQSSDKDILNDSEALNYWQMEDSGISSAGHSGSYDITSSQFRVNDPNHKREWMIDEELAELFHDFPNQAYDQESVLNQPRILHSMSLSDMPSTNSSRNPNLLNLSHPNMVPLSMPSSSTTFQDPTRHAHKQLEYEEMTNFLDDGVGSSLDADEQEIHDFPLVSPSQSCASRLGPSFATTHLSGLGSIGSVSGPTGGDVGTCLEQRGILEGGEGEEMRTSASHPHLDQLTGEETLDSYNEFDPFVDSIPEELVGIDLIESGDTYSYTTVSDSPHQIAKAVDDDDDEFVLSGETTFTSTDYTLLDDPFSAPRPPSLREEKTLVDAVLSSRTPASTQGARTGVRRCGKERSVGHQASMFGPNRRRKSPLKPIDLRHDMYDGPAPLPQLPLLSSSAFSPGGGVSSLPELDVSGLDSALQENYWHPDSIDLTADYANMGVNSSQQADPYGCQALDNFSQTFGLVYGHPGASRICAVHQSPLGACPCPITSYSGLFNQHQVSSFLPSSTSVLSRSRNQVIRRPAILRNNKNVVVMATSHGDSMLPSSNQTCLQNTKVSKLDHQHFPFSMAESRTSGLSHQKQCKTSSIQLPPSEETASAYLMKRNRQMQQKSQHTMSSIIPQDHQKVQRATVSDPRPVTKVYQPPHQTTSFQTFCMTNLSQQRLPKVHSPPRKPQLTEDELAVSSIASDREESSLRLQSSKSNSFWTDYEPQIKERKEKVITQDMIDRRPRQAIRKYYSALKKSISRNERKAVCAADIDFLQHSLRPLSCSVSTSSANASMTSPEDETVSVVDEGPVEPVSQNQSVKRPIQNLEKALELLKSGRDQFKVILVDNPNGGQEAVLIPNPPPGGTSAPTTSTTCTQPSQGINTNTAATTTPTVDVIKPISGRSLLKNIQVIRRSDGTVQRSVAPLSSNSTKNTTKSESGTSQTSQASNVRSTARSRRNNVVKLTTYRPEDGCVDIDVSAHRSPYINYNQLCHDNRYSMGNY